MTSYINKRNLHLIIAVLILIPASLLYGFYAEQLFPMLFEVDIEAIDLRNIFRAIMFLYLGMASLMILGVVKPEYWRFSTLLSLVFMGSLAFGRAFSLVIDGQPAAIFILGFFGELLLSGFSFWQLRHYSKDNF